MEQGGTSSQRSFLQQHRVVADKSGTAVRVLDLIRRVKRVGIALFPTQPRETNRCVVSIWLLGPPISGDSHPNSVVVLQDYQRNFWPRIINGINSLTIVILLPPLAIVIREFTAEKFLPFGWRQQFGAVAVRRIKLRHPALIRHLGSSHNPYSDQVVLAAWREWLWRRARR